jgi:hypothetical protein
MNNDTTTLYKKHGRARLTHSQNHDFLYLPLAVKLCPLTNMPGDSTIDLTYEQLTYDITKKQKQ